MIRLYRNNTPMLNLHSLLSDLGTAVGAVSFIVTLLRIDEVAVFFRTHFSLTTELLRVRSEKKDAIAKMTEQHVGQLALQDAVTGLKEKVDILDERMAESIADRQHLHGLLDTLQPRFDGAISYIHSLTAWGLRLLRALKANHVHIGIDENLPKPPDVLLEYVPEALRPPEIPE